MTQEKVPFLGGMLGHRDVLSAWYVSGTELARRWGPSGITLMPQDSTPSLPLYLSSVMGGQESGVDRGLAVLL